LEVWSASAFDTTFSILVLAVDGVVCLVIGGMQQTFAPSQMAVLLMVLVLQLVLVSIATR
jgi:citrate lyase alpha subunit